MLGRLSCVLMSLKPPRLGLLLLQPTRLLTVAPEGGLFLREQRPTTTTGELQLSTFCGHRISLCTAVQCIYFVQHIYMYDCGRRADEVLVLSIESHVKQSVYNSSVKVAL